jgi:hypothetical protein
MSIGCYKASNRLNTSRYLIIFNDEVIISAGSRCAEFLESYDVISSPQMEAHGVKGDLL